MSMVVRLATVEDVPVLASFIGKAFDDGLVPLMEKSSRFSEQELFHNITGEVVHLVELDGKVVAYSYLSFSTQYEDNRFMLMGIPEYLWEGCAGIRGCIVSPTVRGRGLQRRLLELREEEAIKRGCTFLHARVNRDNTASLNNLLTLGMKIGYELVLPDRVSFLMVKELSPLVKNVS